MVLSITVWASFDPMPSPTFFPVCSTARSAPKMQIVIATGWYTAGFSLESSLQFHSLCLCVLRQ